MNPKADSTDLEDFVDVGLQPILARDVLLVPGVFPRGKKELLPLSRERVLSNGVRLGPFDLDVARLIMNSCAPRGHNYILLHGGSVLYAFWTEYEEHEELQSTPRLLNREWDADRRIMRATQMSRLVLSNTHGTQFAATVVDYEGGVQQVIPYASTTTPHASTLSRLQPESRDWLTDAEADEMGLLLDRYQNREFPLPERINAAMYFHEYSARIDAIEPFVVLLLMSLEALLNTSHVSPTAQIVKRIPLLAAEVGMNGFSKSRACLLYKIRSIAAHNVSTFPKQVDTSGKYKRVFGLVSDAQEILSRTLRRAILDPDFAAIFDSAQSVEQKFKI